MLGIWARKGDEIILSDFNVLKVAALPACCGLVPVLIDIDPKTFNINDNLSKFTAKAKQLGATLEDTGIFSTTSSPNTGFLFQACHQNRG
jgi:hypothetical protein